MSMCRVYSGDATGRILGGGVASLWILALAAVMVGQPRFCVVAGFLQTGSWYMCSLFPCVNVQYSVS